LSYKVIVDSCCELTEEYRSNVECAIVPMGITVDDYHIIDDDTFDQQDFLRRAAASPNCPKSNCSSPEAYTNVMDTDAEHIYIVTLSAELSGSYNSAVLGARMYEEEHEGKKIHVFNSRSAASGETQIAFWIREYEEQGLLFEEIVEIIEKKIDERRTFFVLESLEALRKNGRLGTVKALVANVLSIKPIMAGTLEGTIVQMGQARGIDKALSKMIDMMLENNTTEGKTLMISQCNCPERAEKLRLDFLARAKFKDTLILEARGITSLYASDGGVVVTF